MHAGMKALAVAIVVTIGCGPDKGETTKATLADAFRLALSRTGHALGRAPSREKR